MTSWRRCMLFAMMHAPCWAQWLQPPKASLHSKPCTQAALIMVMVYLLWQICSHMVPSPWSLLVQLLIMSHLRGNSATSELIKAQQWKAYSQAMAGYTIQAVKFREQICIPGFVIAIHSWAIWVLRALRLSFVLDYKHISSRLQLQLLLHLRQCWAQNHPLQDPNKHVLCA